MHLASAAAVIMLGATLAVVPASATVSAPNDPFFPRQWNLTQVGAPLAWTRATGQGVIIGIVDTGVDLEQEDLAGKVLASTDCVGSEGDEAACTGSGQDDNGHGTHVAGIAAADTNNGKGIAGMAPNAKLVVAKALNSQGSGSFADVNAGIEWVVAHGARVVNLSLGSDIPALDGLAGANLTTGVNYAWSHGAIPVMAAGNENFFGLGSSNYANVNAVIVGATGPDDRVASYSSPLGNAKWALVAPGGDGEDSSGSPSCEGAAQADCIISTWWSASNPVDEYAYDQGTSMATPMVSGTLALLLGEGLDPTQAVNTLLSSADKSVSCGSGCAGRLDAARAVGAEVSVQSRSQGTPTTGAGSTGGGSSRASSAPAASAGSSPTGPVPASASGAASSGWPPSTVPAPLPPTRTAGVGARPGGAAGGQVGPGAGAEVAGPGPKPAKANRSNNSTPYVLGGLAALLLGLVSAVVRRVRERAGPPGGRWLRFRGAGGR